MKKMILVVLLVAIAMVLSACDGVDEYLSEGDAAAQVEDELDIFVPIEDIPFSYLQNEGYSSTQRDIEVPVPIPNFNELSGNFSGSFFGSTRVYNFLITRDSPPQLFILVNVGGWGNNLYHYDLFGSNTFTRMDVDLRYYVPTYSWRGGERVRNYGRINHNHIIGFFELDGDYFFVSSVNIRTPEDGGAIGRLVRTDIHVYDDEGRRVSSRQEWHIGEHLFFACSPKAFFADSDSVYIVTRSSTAARSKIYRVYNNEITVLHEGVNLDGIRSPIAMEKINNTLFMKSDRGEIWSFNINTGEVDMHLS